MPRSKFGNDQVDHDLADHEDIVGGPGQTPEDGESFVYSTSAGKFALTPVAGGHARGHSLTNILDHIDFAGGAPSDGDVLVFCSSSGKWELEAQTGGGTDMDGVVYVDTGDGNAEMVYVETAEGEIELVEVEE